MTFVSGFYRFDLTISDTTRNVYDRTSIKVPRHPDESLAELYARVIGFCHSYEPGLSLSAGMFQPREPSAYIRDLLDNTQLWVQVGCPSQEKITRALRTEHDARFVVYLVGEEQVERFCHYLRGAKTNWVRRIHFYLITPEFLERLSHLDQSSSSWAVTIVDNLFYLVFDEREFETTIESIDIWERFQTSLREQTRT